MIERSIIGFGARIGPRALIRDGVIGDGADIGALRVVKWCPGMARCLSSRRRDPLLVRRLSFLRRDRHRWPGTRGAHPPRLSPRSALGPAVAGVSHAARQPATRRGDKPSPSIRT